MSPTATNRGGPAGGKMWVPLGTDMAELGSRFWAKVERGDGCWLWRGQLTRDGYGAMCYLGTSESDRAHRLAWKLVHGPIPRGKCVRHHCDNPPCVNPEHLALGTHRDNMADMVRRQRMAGRDNSLYRGSLSGATKLTEALVLALRGEYASGAVSSVELARRHGLARSSMQHLLYGITWAHVPDAITVCPRSIMKAQLTRWGIKSARRRYLAGERVETLAREMGVGVYQTRKALRPVMRHWRQRGIRPRNTSNSPNVAEAQQDKVSSV